MMFGVRRWWSWRASTGAALLALGLAIGPMSVGHAGATYSTCQNCAMRMVATAPDLGPAYGLQIPQ